MKTCGMFTADGDVAIMAKTLWREPLFSKVTRKTAVICHHEWSDVTEWMYDINSKGISAVHVSPNLFDIAYSIVKHIVELKDMLYGRSKPRKQRRKKRK